MMKIEPDNPDKEKTEAAHGRMGGRFYVTPFEVHDKLAKIRNVLGFYDCILRNAVINEDWETKTVWVLGRFQATADQFFQWTGKSKSYSRILLNKLITAKIILLAQDGSFKLPMYKKKADEGIRVADIQGLKKKVADLELIVREVVANGKIPMAVEMAAVPEVMSNGQSPMPADSVESPEEKKNNIIVLSREKVISMFYKGIGQRRISREKREKARNVYKELRKDNFTPEEISFAVTWTLENANEKPYDFALIQSTIGQALAAMKKVDAQKQAREEIQEEIDSQREEIEEQERESDDWEFYKADMPEKDREGLRKNAIEEIAASGEYAPEFISDILITVKENEILRRELPEDEEETGSEV